MHLFYKIDYLFKMSISSTERPKSNRERHQKNIEDDSSWSRLINGIIRPPRSSYKQGSLGKRNFIINETNYERKDIQIMHQQKFITITLFQPQYKNNWLILYLHGNSSSKLQCIGIIKFLPFKCSLASFDFIGCGLNHQDDTISLGVRQSQQVVTIVKFLEKAGFNVLLWGRSMGAATALKFGKAPVIVADSSFKSFKSLCKQIAKRNSPKFLPNCLISCLFPCVFSKLRSDIQDKGHYDIQQLDIANDVKKITPDTTLIFMSGDQDNLIDMTNSEKLYKSFRGQKKYLQIFKGTHNTKRPEATIKKIMGYINEYISKNKQPKFQLSKSKIQVDLHSEIQHS